jgi:hypothetical protein
MSPHFALFCWMRIMQAHFSNHLSRFTFMYAENKY